MDLSMSRDMQDPMWANVGFAANMFGVRYIHHGSKPWYLDERYHVHYEENAVMICLLKTACLWSWIFASVFSHSLLHHTYMPYPHETNNYQCHIYIHIIIV